jgi:predicted nucleic acid-binding protein
MAIPVTGKLMIDTNVFVSYLRAGLHENWIEGRIEETTRFLSSVVLFELTVGAGSNKRTNLIKRLVRTFPRSRIVAPTDSVYRKAADIFLRLFGKNSQAWPQDRLGPVNDILIAVTAYRMGATVITENEKDFSRIASHLPGFRLSIPH